MMLLHPIWLVLAIPLALSLWLWRMPTRLLTVMRAGLLALALAGLCGLAIRLPTRAGTIVVVADRSVSMPANAEKLQKEAIDLLASKMGAGDRLAVVSFGHAAAIEQPPQAGQFAGFRMEVGPDGSNLADGLDLALALVGREDPGRIMVLSDGAWTGRDPLAPAALAASRGVAMDYRLLARPAANDVAIVGMDAPAEVGAGEAFAMTAWIWSPLATEATVDLYRGETRLASGRRTLVSGVNRLSFRDIAGEAGAARYELRVAAVGEDPVPENNQARLLVGVRGELPVLCVSEGGDSGLLRLLKAGGLKVQAARSEAVRWELEDLARHSAVLLENVPASAVGESGLTNLAAWARNAGTGVMMTGGRQAYGVGGYFKSPLEAVMPVSMELRREHRKLALSIVVALDRSGSMSLPVPGGKVKMDLANLGTAAVLDLLTSMDEFGCLAVDSSPHVISPLVKAENKGPIRAKILSIQSMGGGIFIYEALSQAARMLSGAQNGTRHIILFADAADSEEPGKYQELLEACRKAGVTVSVIGLGTPKDQDADLLRDIAKRGSGNIYFTDKPAELPRLFAQDTFIIARNAFIDEPVAVRATPGLLTLTGRPLEAVPKLGGYNLSYLRPGATLGIVTTDENKAPIVAAWQAGAGRVLCYTGEADGKHTGPIGQWSDVGTMFTSLARWAAGQSNPLPEGMMLSHQVTEGACRIRLMLDPELQRLPFTSLPNVDVLLGSPGREPRTQAFKMQWTAPDELSLDVPLTAVETAIASVSVPAVGAGQPVRVTLPPVCLPYSPEFRRRSADEGPAALERLARATGGMARVELPSIWKDVPRRPMMIDLTPWLLTAAMVLLLLEVLQRRTGLVAAIAPGLASMWRRVVGRLSLVTIGRPRRQDRAARDGAKDKHVKERPAGAAPEPAPVPSGAAEKPSPPTPAQPDMLDALSRARRRAKGRID